MPNAVRDGEFLATRLALSFTESCSFNNIILLNFEIIKDFWQGCLYFVSFKLHRLKLVYFCRMAVPLQTSRKQLQFTAPRNILLYLFRG
jgi:hypothetical protein